MLMIYHCLHCYFFWTGHQCEVYEVNVAAIFQIRKLRRLREDRVLSPQAPTQSGSGACGFRLLLSTLCLHLQRHPNTASASPRRRTPLPGLTGIHRIKTSPRRLLLSLASNWRHLKPLSTRDMPLTFKVCAVRKSSIFLVGIVFPMHMAY